MKFQSGLARRGLLLVICVCLAGCEPAATHVPLPATRSPILPTLLPDTPSVMTTLTHTPLTATTATPIVDPYGKIPEQVGDGWDVASLSDAGIDPSRIMGSLDDQVLPNFPNYLPLDDPDARKEEIAIEDLLTMRNGLDCDDWDPYSCSYYQKQQPNRVDEIEYILNLPMRTNPGSQYSYCTWGVTVLNAMLMDATGRRLSEFAEQNLLQPLGIDDARWHDAVGRWDEIDGVSVMLPRDMARVGQLMLQNGNWNGTQIVPQAWVERSTRRHTSIPVNSTWGKDYGYLWWFSEVKIAGTQIHSISASGHGGQVITIFPDLSIVVVITGGNYENDEGQPFEIMERFILPAVLPVH